MSTARTGSGRTTATGARPAPPWPVLVAAEVAFAVLFALVLSPRTALYWYVFPLFGVGATYLWQFRSQFPGRWKAAWISTAVVSGVALALDWPFSGHVLWNVLFIGHAWTTGKRRGAWMTVLVVSLLHLFALKAAFQTGRDVIGAFISVAVAVVLLLALERPSRFRARRPPGP